MKSFRVREGDLVVTAGSAEAVTGQDKLIQDLTLWLKEPIGAGFTTPSFGSVLTDMIGRGDPEVAALEIQSEVQRVLSLYQAYQFEKIKAARLNGRLHAFSRREILNRILSVQAVAVGNAVQVRVHIQTGGGDEVQIPVSVTTDGVNVG